MNEKTESKIVAAALLLKLERWAADRRTKKDASPAERRHLIELSKLLS